MKKQSALLASLLGAAGVLASNLASATTTDYSAIVTSATAEFGAAVTAGLPIGGTILGVSIGWRVFKHFTK